MDPRSIQSRLYDGLIDIGYSLGVKLRLRSGKEYFPPRPEDPHPPDVIDLMRCIGRGENHTMPFYVDFKDPESLVRELQRYHMAGMVIYRRGNVRGRLFLIGYDDMPTSILRRSQPRGFAAVYGPDALDFEQSNSLGGSGLRPLDVYRHPALYGLTGCGWGSRAWVEPPDEDASDYDPDYTSEEEISPKAIEEESSNEDLEERPEKDSTSVRRRRNYTAEKESDI
ncbi:hypothetical protein ABW21_db0206716 [Orbilia brochopaga]|nr:hypothetical protein ABW21_db0206716 [Drechslerella brochopaga]